MWRAAMAEWLFAVDTLAEIAVSLPLSGSALNQVNQAVAGQTDPNAQVVVWVNGAELARGVADANGHFALTGVTLPVGTFTLQAEATDPYGHVATQPMALTLDPSAASRSSREIERVKTGEFAASVGGQITLCGPGGGHGGQTVHDIFLCHLAPAFLMPRLLVILCVCVY